MSEDYEDSMDVEIVEEDDDFHKASDWPDPDDE